MEVLAGRYVIGDEIGRGGMAAVYRGRLVGANGFERPIAIKRIHPGHFEQAEFIAMFRREAHIASLLSHPNIVAVMDLEVDASGELFIVMEYVDGVDLRSIVKRGALPVPVAVHIATMLLGALDYAQRLTKDGAQLGIVHRDVTPHNVLLSRSGDVKLSDFGIAKALSESPLTKTGIVKGKVGYMSPEQARGEPVDGRSDLFSVGIILFELLAGARLFKVGSGAAGLLELQRRFRTGLPALDSIRSGLSSKLTKTCGRLLALDRRDRFADGAAAVSALLDCPEVHHGAREILSGLVKEHLAGEEGAMREVPTAALLEPVATDVSGAGFQTTTVPTLAEAQAQDDVPVLRTGDDRGAGLASRASAPESPVRSWRRRAAAAGLALMAIGAAALAFVSPRGEGVEPRSQKAVVPARLPIVPVASPRAEEIPGVELPEKESVPVPKETRPKRSHTRAPARSSFVSQRAEQAPRAPTPPGAKAPDARPTIAELEGRLEAAGEKLRARSDVLSSERAVELDELYFDLLSRLRRAEERDAERLAADVRRFEAALPGAKPQEGK